MNKFTFAGEQVDTTGVQYLRARYYDPAVGRFLSQDPLPLLQRYPYVGNNPANLVDPAGLCARIASKCWTIRADGSAAWRRIRYDPYEGGNFDGYRTPFGEPVDCVLAFGPEACYWIREAGVTAWEEGLRMGLTSGDWDAFVHCYGSAILATWYDQGTAKAAGDFHERYSQSVRQTAQDIHNNEAGRRIAARVPDTNSDPIGFAKVACYEGLSNGLLDTTLN